MSTATENLPAKPQANLREPAENPQKLKALLDWAKPSIAMALPRHLTPERMIRVAVTAIQRTPKLLECTQLSLVSAVVEASELGLELSNVLGRCYLVPYQNHGVLEAQLQIGYRGYIALAYRTGEVEYFNGGSVREGDVFDYEKGTDQFLKHKPRGTDENRPFTHFYSCFRLVNGGKDFIVMTKAAVDAHRQRYSRDTRKDSAWNTSYEAMAIKTPIRKLAKTVPLSTDLVTRALEVDDRNMEALAGDLMQLPGPGSPPMDLASKLKAKAEEATNGAQKAATAASGDGQVTTDTDYSDLLQDIAGAGTVEELDHCELRIRKGGWEEDRETALISAAIKRRRVLEAN